MSHVDTTIIKLIDGAKIYLHAVIDNYSRKILAWSVAEKFEFATTVTILRPLCQTSCRPYSSVTYGAER